MITRQHYDDPRWRAKTARSTGAREFRQVMKRLERKGTPAFVQERMAAKTGRKRVVSWAAFIRLCTLAAFHSEATFHLVDVMHVADGLTPSQRREVGFTRCDYHHVEYAFRRWPTLAMNESVWAMAKSRILGSRCRWMTSSSA